MMEDIGLFKQGWKWLQSKKHCYLVARTAASCFRDKIGIFIERHWPVVCCGCARLGNVLYFLLIHSKDCVVRGFWSFVRFGSAALLVIMWSCFLSLTSSCLAYVILSMGLAGGAVQYLGYTPGLFIVGLCAILVLWMYANFWITGTLFIVGALGFSRHKKIDAVLLKKEYRKKVMLVHPDKNMGSPLANESFMKLQCASELSIPSKSNLGLGLIVHVLSDSMKKRDYDEQLRKEEYKNVSQKSPDTPR